MIGEAAKIEALVTDWDSIPVENIGEGIDRQMVVGENIMICEFHSRPERKGRPGGRCASFSP
jgi:hypothetical protein